MKPLTDRQLQILAAIAALVEAKGYAPSIRELGKDTGITSTYGVECAIVQLEKRGLVIRDPRIARSMRITVTGKRILKDLAGLLQAVG